MSDAFAIPPMPKERGAQRREPLYDPSQAATAMLRALAKGDPGLIDGAVVWLASELAKGEMGTAKRPNEMTAKEVAQHRQLVRVYRYALPKLDRVRLRTLCLELGGVEPATDAVGDAKAA